MKFMGINKVHVEVAYATPQEQRIVGLDIVEGASMYDAVIQSGIQKYSLKLIQIHSLWASLVRP